MVSKFWIRILRLKTRTVLDKELKYERMANIYQFAFIMSIENAWPKCIFFPFPFFQSLQRSQPYFYLCLLVPQIYYLFSSVCTTKCLLDFYRKKCCINISFVYQMFKLKLLKQHFLHIFTRNVCCCCCHHRLLLVYCNCGCSQAMC